MVWYADVEVMGKPQFRQARTLENINSGLTAARVVLQSPISVHNPVAYIYICLLVQSPRTSARPKQKHFLQAPSFHPIGTNAAATCCKPLSVANKLNCAAAFRVSWISTRTPSSVKSFLVAGLRGRIPGPVPRISKSGFGHTRSKAPQAILSASHCPFAFFNFPLMLDTPFTSPPAAPSPIVPSFLPGRTHGRHLKASPPTSMTPAPVMRSPLFNAKPSSMHASMPVVGGGMPPKTSSAPKSVCVSSLLVGPRSLLLGAASARAEACRRVRDLNCGLCGRWSDGLGALREVHMEAAPAWRGLLQRTAGQSWCYGVESGHRSESSLSPYDW
jgi:hypothetical protein